MYMRAAGFELDRLLRASVRPLPHGVCCLNYLDNLDNRGSENCQHSSSNDDVKTWG